MWCPKCKNEYIEGITRCADCGLDLTETLTENSKTFDSDVFSMPDAANAPTILDEEETPAASAFVSKRTKQEDLRSTAYSFVLVSILGAVLLILFAVGIIPLNMTGYMKVLSCSVMGIVFLLFFIIGIRSFIQLKSVKKEVLEEERYFKTITEWFKGANSADRADWGIDGNQPKEQLYFARYEKMKQLVEEKYPSLDEAFLDHIIESLYDELFSNENAD